MKVSKGNKVTRIEIFISIFDMLILHHLQLSIYCNKCIKVPLRNFPVLHGACVLMRDPSKTIPPDDRKSLLMQSEV